MSFDPAPTLESHADFDAGRLTLLVIADGHATAHELPARGAITIGRGSRCDIVVDHPSVSRAHVVLHLDHGIEVEDTSSTNGSRVGARTLGPGERLRVEIGEAITIGDVALLLQDRGRGQRRRKLWGHDYFENRTEEECQRAETAGATFALIHAHLTPALDDDRTAELFGAVLRTTDVIGRYGSGELEVLAPGIDRAEADSRAAQLEAHLADLGISTRTGVAVYPHDGESHHALAARALARLRNVDTHTGEVRVVVAAPRMRELHSLIARIAPSDISVLLLGETGVGKEVVAETLQRRSRRADGPFVKLNCAALTETLLESELFGHERGAFTGATATKLGLLESAAGGTVLLDEIGELPMAVQVKLLRVLEERAVLRVGGVTPIAIDVRFVAATHRDLAFEIGRGRFREDLYYRLAGVTLTVPPLRERQDELEPMARLFINSFCRRNQLAPIPHLSHSAVEWLRGHSWPGNLRELRNLVERAVLLGRGPLILPEHLPLPVAPPSPPPAASSPAHTATSVRRVDPPTAPHAPLPPHPPAALATVDDERARIVAALDACAGNQTRAAVMLNISRRTLVYRLGLYGLARPRRPAGA